MKRLYIKDIYKLLNEGNKIEAKILINKYLKNESIPKSIKFFLNKNLKDIDPQEISTIDYTNKSNQNLENKFQYHLSINPSYANQQEIDFWDSFHNDMRQRSKICIKEIRFRKFAESTNKKFCKIFPAKLNDLNNVFRKNYKYSLSELPLWMTEKDLALQVDWEHRRWQINKYNQNIEKGMIQLAWFIDSYIKDENCISVITSNKLDHPNRFGFLAVLHYKKNYTFVERSPFMGHLIEPRGMFAESRLEEFLINPEISNTLNKEKNQVNARNILTKNIYGFRPQQTTTINETKQKVPFLFFPLDNILWTGWAPNGHPQGKIDYQNFQNLYRLLDLLIEFCAANKLILLVKPHPSCKEYSRLKKDFPSISFESNIDLIDLIQNAKLIVCGLSKVAFNSAALGKEVITVGKNPANYLPNVHYCNDETELLNRLNHTVKKPEKSNYRSLDLMLNKIHCYYKETEYNFTKVLAKQTKGTKIIEENISLHYEARIKSSINDLLKRINSALKEKRIPVLLDITRLINTKLRHSGITKFITVLLSELREISEIDIIPYISAFPIIEYGLAAYELNSILDEYSISSAYHLNQESLSSINEEYIYLSPHLPLPKLGNFCRRIITIHDILHLTEIIYETTGVKKVTQKIVDSIKFDDQVVSVSEFSKAALQGIRPDIKNISVINLPPVLNKLSKGVGADIRKCIYDLSSKYRRSYILIPVQADMRKRLDLMIRAGDLAMQNSPDLNCLFFGKESSKKLLKSSIEDSNLTLESNCHFIESPSDNELLFLYQNALTTLYLSDSEGYGLPPLEALAAGCLPITRMVTGICDSMKGYTHGLQEPLSIEKITRKINQFKNYSPLNYRDEVLINQKNLNSQINIKLGEKYYQEISKIWKSKFTKTIV